MRLIIFILLIFSAVCVNSQVYINSYSFGVAAAADSLPLNVAGSKSGYSLRKIRTAYGGSAVNVRRSSDNTTQDIGFDGSGNFDVSAFNTFIGGGNGFAVTWYDQGTDGYNATQATNANQPQITLSAQNGRPVLTFDGTDYLTIPVSQSFFIYLHSTGGETLFAGRVGIVSDPNTIYAMMGNLAGTSTKIGINLYFDDRASQGRNNGLFCFVGNGTSLQPPIERNENNFLTPNTFTLINTLVDPDNGTDHDRLDYYLNNVYTAATNSNGFTPVTSNATHTFQIGANGNNASIFVGTMAEVVTYNIIRTTATRNATALNMDNYYAY